MSIYVSPHSILKKPSFAILGAHNLATAAQSPAELKKIFVGGKIWTLNLPM